MPISTRQTSLLAAEDWSKAYQSFKDADFQSYDFETIRKSMIDYLRLYYPEDFNDYIESSEYIALIDLIATLGQSLAYRNDLNTRENFIDTAERRESIIRLARLISYNPKRSNPASGILKLTELSTTEFLNDSNGLDIANSRIIFNDGNNPNWQEQFNIIFNASFTDSQRIGQPGSSKTIANIKTDEYTINTDPGALPIFSFNSTVNGLDELFEVTSVSTANKENWYEPAPIISGAFNLLYRNDNLGNTSVNTGYFMHFKQGTIRSIDFEISDGIPNRLVSIDVASINQSDVWLYQLDGGDNEDVVWEQVPAVTGQNIAYNSVTSGNREIYQVVTNADDSVNLLFGDGVFAKIPRGQFRLYYRVSNGEGYKISPSEMASISVPINYVSRTGRVETITLTGSLQYTVSNASPRETDEDIRQRAPQQYYTQNRMVNGEDYNILPYTTFNNVIKAKAINRSSSGISRFLDVVDKTGKYSSTNIFCDDGLLYSTDVTTTINFEFTQSSEISQLLQNQISQIISGTEMKHFYFDNFERFNPDNVNMEWTKLTSASNQSTGYFSANTNNNILQIGAIVSGTSKHITSGSLIRFKAPSGYYFDNANILRLLPDRPLQNGESTTRYTSVKTVIGDGAANGVGALPNGTGPVILNDVIPSGTKVNKIIPYFSNELSVAVNQQIISNMILYKNFALRYDLTDKVWVLIDSSNVDLATNNDFSSDFAGDTSSQNLDASWLINFVTDGQTYFISSRGLKYEFESVLQTRFYFDPDLKVFDPKDGTVIHDVIKILKINTAPDTNDALGFDAITYVYDNVIEVDGYENNKKIKITYADSDNDGTPDDPDIFRRLIQPDVNPETKLIFFKKTSGYANFEELVSVDNKTMVTKYENATAINLELSLYDDGQLFYIQETHRFYVLTVEGFERSITESFDYIGKTGRQDLYFQYIHNSPNDRRIDPSPNNIIDLFLLTRQYETDYKNWISDVTGTVAEPGRPTAEELRTEFAELDSVKMLSDSLIYNSAKFKPLFGAEAASELQATFKVVKNNNVNTSDSQIRSKLISAINKYFEVSNWDFGETFYFTELSTYLHQELVPDVASIIIVSKDGKNQFGSLFQINSDAQEILTSVATVEDVEIISAITAAQIRFDTGD